MPSAARVVYNHYGGKAAFPASLTRPRAQLLQPAPLARGHPQPPGGVAGSISRLAHGLWPFLEFRISGNLRADDGPDPVLLPRPHHRRDPAFARDVQSAQLSTASTPPKAQAQLQSCAIRIGNLVVLDLRDEETIWAHQPVHDLRAVPQCNISIQQHVGLGKVL